MASDEKILKALKEAPLLKRTVPALAKKLGISESAVRQRLYVLEAAGKVRREGVVGKTVVWEAHQDNPKGRRG